MQRREPDDARRVESHLLELLRRCSHVYDNIARTHTRLLSTTLVTMETLKLSPGSGLSGSGSGESPNWDQFS